MDDFLLAATKHTPKVELRVSEHRLVLQGEAYPENAVVFFTPLIQALNAYLARPAEQPLLVIFQLRYMNSASTKMIFRLAALLNAAAETGRPIVLEVHHDPEDEMLVEFAEDLAKEFRVISIKLVQVV